MEGQQHDVLETWLREKLNKDKWEIGADVFSAKMGKAKESIQTLPYPVTNSSASPLFLRQVKPDGESIWILIAFNDRQFREYRDFVQSFIGPTYSEPVELTADNVSDPDISTLQELSRGYFYQFQGDNKVIQDKLYMFYRIMEKRPPVVEKEFRPTGRILRDFYMALQIGNRESAEKSIQFLKENLRIDHLNELFLRIQMLGEFGCWGEILELPNINDIIYAPRPTNVSRQIIYSLYHCFLKDFVETKNWAVAQEVVRTEIKPMYSNLLATCPVIADAIVAKTVLLFATLSKNPPSDLMDKVISLSLKQEELSDLNEIAELVPSWKEKAVVLNENSLNALMDNGDYAAVLFKAIKLPVSVKRACVLLECAYELQTLEAEMDAYQAFQLLSESEQNEVLSSRRYRNFWETIFSQSKPNEAQSVELQKINPQNWCEWIARVNKEDKWSRASEVAQKAVLEWDINFFIDDHDNIDKFSKGLSESRTDLQEEVLFNALPHIMTFLQKDSEFPRREFKNVYENIVNLLVLGTEGGDDDLAFFNDIASSLLSLGISPSMYQDLLDYACEMWKKYASPSKVDWVLDFLDLLMISACPDTVKRTDTLFIIENKMRLLVHRLQPYQHKCLSLLFRDIAHDDYFAEHYPKIIKEEGASDFENEKSAFDKLAGKSIALYTLTESVGKRVETLIREFDDGIKVQISSDKVGTDRLKQMSRTADIFVIAWLSAKHAATQFIQSNRPKEKPLLYAAGKGSASFMQAIQAYLQ